MFRSVFEGRQLNAVLKCIRKLQCIRYLNSFRFGDFTVQSFDIIEISHDNTSPWRPIPVLLDVIPVGILSLLKLDALCKRQLCSDNFTNRLVHLEVLSRKVDSQKYEHRRNVPLNRYDYHLYCPYEVPNVNFLYISQLKKMDKEFTHSSVIKQHIC